MPYVDPMDLTLSPVKGATNMNDNLIYMSKQFAAEGCTFLGVPFTEFARILTTYPSIFKTSFDLTCQVTLGPGYSKSSSLILIDYSLCWISAAGLIHPTTPQIQ